MSTQEQINKKIEIARDPLIDLLVDTISDRPLLMAFDRDGTISNIASDPNLAPVYPASLAALNRLADIPDTDIAIVSARSLRMLRGDFGSFPFTLAGNYGLEIEYANNKGKVDVDAGAAAQASNLGAVKKELLEIASDMRYALFFEDHQFTLCLHYHCTPAELLDEVHARVQAVERRHGEFVFAAQPTSYEVLPRVTFHKGLALEAITKRLYGQAIHPIADSQIHLKSAAQIDLEAAQEKSAKENGQEQSREKAKSRLFFFAGDSDGDEPAFAWVNQAGGISLKVGPPGESQAQYYMKDPAHLASLLNRLAEVRSSRFASQP